SKIVFYTQTGILEDTQTAAGLIASHAAGTTLSVQSHDVPKVAAAIDPLMRGFGPLMRQSLRFCARDRLAMTFASMTFRRVGGPFPRYVLDWPPNALPAPISTKLHPTVVVGKDQIVGALAAEAADRALADSLKWQPVGDFAPVARRLPAEMIYL